MIKNVFNRTFFSHNYINTDLLNSNTASVIKIPSTLRGNGQNDRSLNHRYKPFEQ